MPQSFTFALSGIPYYPDFLFSHAYFEAQQSTQPLQQVLTCSDLTQGQRLNFDDDDTLQNTERGYFNEQEAKKIRQEIELQSYLQNLILEDREKKTENLSDPDEKEKELEFDDRLSDLNHMFSQADDCRKNRYIPNHLCCKISFGLMRDPVITPCGITYEKKNIEQHLRRVGHFDPVTRADLTAEKLIPNLAMKEVVDMYLQDNPWAEEF